VTFERLPLKVGKIFKSILNYKFKFRDGPWDKISESAKDFIRKIFVPVDQRMSSEECLTHPWINDNQQGIKNDGEKSVSLQEFVNNRLPKVEKLSSSSEDE